MSTILPTCAGCEHYREFYGEHPKRGECYGNLPQIFESGSHTTREIAAPKVRASRPACFAFKALPEGTDTIEKGKQTPETVGDAVKLKHAEAANGATTVPPVTVPPAKRGKR